MLVTLWDSNLSPDWYPYQEICTALHFVDSHKAEIAF